jgi:mannan endo-1,4-beta-mannosidase
MKFSVLTFVSLLASLASAAPTAVADNKLETRATFSSFAGTNAYWIPFLTNDADVDTTFRAIQAAGLKVVRTWGFSDSTSCSGVYFQCWSSSTPTINTGSNGLQRMDVVVNTAAKYGIKLVIPLGMRSLLLRKFSGQD